MTRLPQFSRRLVAAVIWCTSCSAAFAGEFSVKPIRLDVVHSAKSTSVSVVNDGAEKISFQLQAMDWTQDKDGKDQYADSRDLIFFPKLFAVEPGQEALVRIGFKSPVTTTEKTYRLFIEELPGIVKKTEANSAQINVLIRFGLPIFVKPALTQDGLAIEAVELTNSVLSFTARNSGNRHQIYKSIRLEGLNAANKPVFSLDLADNYLLASAAKPYKTTLSALQCRELVSLVINIETDKLIQSRKLDVKPDMCL